MLCWLYLCHYVCRFWFNVKSAITDDLTLLIPCFSKWWGASFWECLINHGSMCGTIIHDLCPHDTTSFEISELVRSHFTDESTDNVFQFSSVQFSLVAHLCLTLYDPIDCSTPGFPVHYQLPELVQTHVHQVSDGIQPSHSRSSPSPLAFNLSQHQGLCQWVSFCIRWPKYWSFSFSISPSNGYSGLISFRMDGLDLLAVQGTLKSLLQHHSPKASILWLSAFFIVQLSHPYMTTGKTIALARWTFVGKVMSLLFNMSSSLAIAFLLKIKCLLISWLQSPSAVILEPRKIKSVTVSTVFPSICHEVMGLDAMILVFWVLSFKPTQTKPCVHQETPQRLNQTCLWVFGCLLWSYGSAVDYHNGRGSGCSRPG